MAERGSFSASNGSICSNSAEQELSFRNLFSPPPSMAAFASTSQENGVYTQLRDSIIKFSRLKQPDRQPFYFTTSVGDKVKSKDRKRNRKYFERKSNEIAGEIYALLSGVRLVYMYDIGGLNILGARHMIQHIKRECSKMPGQDFNTDFDADSAEGNSAKLPFDDLVALQIGSQDTLLFFARRSAVIHRIKTLLQPGKIVTSSQVESDVTTAESYQGTFNWPVFVDVSPCRNIPSLIPLPENIAMAHNDGKSSESTTSDNATTRLANIFDLLQKQLGIIVDALICMEQSRCTINIRLAQPNAEASVGEEDDCIQELQDSMLLPLVGTLLEYPVVYGFFFRSGEHLGGANCAAARPLKRYRLYLASSKDTIRRESMSDDAVGMCARVGDGSDDIFMLPWSFTVPSHLSDEAVVQSAISAFYGNVKCRLGKCCPKYDLCWLKQVENPDSVVL